MDKSLMHKKEEKEKQQLNALISIGLFAVILTGILFISGCGSDPNRNNPNLKYTEYHTGTSGILLSLLNQQSMDNLYENSTFALSVLLENKGAYDVIGELQAYLTVSFDPYYINAALSGQNNNIAVGKDGKSMVVKGIKLYGKSKYFPTGEQVFLAFSNLATKSIEGQRAQPDTNLFISLCYPYTTVLSKMICVDMNRYTENLRKQVCTQQNIVGTNQGAPVAVSMVEIDNQPVGADYVRPVFIIHINNVGKGNILSPTPNPIDLERVCTADDLRREDFNTVLVQAYLSDSLQLKCTPEVIRMYNNEGIARCSVRDEDLEKVVLWHQNYQSPLTINVSYVYQESLSKQIQIKRFDLYGGAAPRTQECGTNQVKMNGECVSKCVFCSQHPSDSSCQLGSADPIAFDNSFECQCSWDQCSKLEKGMCVPSPSFCSGIGYCCSLPCKSGQIKSKDGKCYSKCTTTCSSITKECLCNPDAKPITSGFCCPLLGESFRTKEDCLAACQNDN